MIIRVGLPVEIPATEPGSLSHESSRPGRHHREACRPGDTDSGRAGGSESAAADGVRPVMVAGPASPPVGTLGPRPGGGGSRSDRDRQAVFRVETVRSGCSYLSFFLASYPNCFRSILKTKKAGKYFILSVDINT
jgi:hypothetical protein